MRTKPIAPLLVSTHPTGIEDIVDFLGSSADFRPSVEERSERGGRQTWTDEVTGVDVREELGGVVSVTPAGSSSGRRRARENLAGKISQ